MGGVDLSEVQVLRWAGDAGGRLEVGSPNERPQAHTLNEKMLHYP